MTWQLKTWDTLQQEWAHRPPPVTKRPPPVTKRRREPHMWCAWCGVDTDRSMFCRPACRHHYYRNL